MNLQDFVRESIIQIARGIEEAEKALKDAKSEAVVNPRYVVPSNDLPAYGVQIPETDDTRIDYRVVVQRVDFDVALHATESRGSQGGVGLFVAGVTLGAAGKSDSGHQSESRIKFMVPVILPFSDRNVS